MAICTINTMQYARCIHGKLPFVKSKCARHV
jgi:hypothetical protein